MLKYYFLYALVAIFVYIWYMREYLTLEEVDKKVSKLGKKVSNIDETLKSQEKRMGQANEQANNAKLLLNSNTA
jgi:hypothetical protein